MKNKTILAIALIVFALFFNSGCLSTEQNNWTNLNIVQAENKTAKSNVTVTEESEYKDAQEIESKHKEMINLTLKIHSDFETAELNGLRELELGILNITIESEETITVLQNQTISLRDTKKKMTVATLEIPVSNYRMVRVAIGNASGLFELSSSIPGILSQRQKKDLIIKSSNKAVFLNQEINESTHLTVNFNIGNITFDKPIFDNSLTSLNVLTYSKCNYDCNLKCIQTIAFGSCYDSCIQNENAICNENAVNLCNSQCNCPNSDCTYAKDEECRSVCIKREQAENSECKVDLNLTCQNHCKEKPDYRSCIKNCNSEC